MATGRLIRSGWWVAVAAVVIVLAMLALALLPRSDRAAPRLGDGRDVTSYGFDLSTCLVPRATLVAGGMPRDGMTALDRPAMLSAAEVERRNSEGRGKFLLATDRVVGLARGGEARAYPLRFLRWHEVVNDLIGGEPVVISYNGLCDAAVAASREVQGETLSFGVSGLLSNSNLLLYDRRDDPAASSLWSQLQGRAVAGPAAAAGASLELLPLALSSWGLWLDRHPETTVLAPLPNLKRAYKRDPYHSYFGSELLHFPVEPLPPAGELAFKDRVVVVRVGDRQAVYDLPGIAAAAGADGGIWRTTLGDAELTITFDRERGTAVVESDRELDAVRYAFWFAWYASHPDAP